MTVEYEDFERCEVCGTGLEPRTTRAGDNDPDGHEPGEVVTVMTCPNPKCPGTTSAETEAGADLT